jgi:hypothetical protein
VGIRRTCRPPKLRCFLRKTRHDLRQPPAGLIGAHLADLGGRDLVSEAEYCLVRRAALLTLELELLESRFEANDGAKAAELECYQRVASSLRRLMESLGLKRRARDVGPTLGEVLREGIRLDREAEDAEVEANG